MAIASLRSIQAISPTVALSEDSHGEIQNPLGKATHLNWIKYLIIYDIPTIIFRPQLRLFVASYTHSQHLEPITPDNSSCFLV
jgi:hypothetical protein